MVIYIAALQNVPQELIEAAKIDGANRLSTLRNITLPLIMPFMEIVPTSGSIASAVIALFAASLLTRDGVLACLSFGLLLVVPVTLYFV